MSTHTTGPWRYDERLLMIVGPAGKNGDTAIACPELTLVDRHRMTAPADGRANARLMAAAPELLEALEGALDVISAIIPGPHRTIRAAIARAKGDA